MQLQMLFKSMRAHKVYYFSLVVQVECKELFYRDFPELGDSIADKLLPGCSTLEEVCFHPHVQINCMLGFFSPWLNLICYDIIQVKKALLERCLEVEKTAKEQATDNAILDQLTKVL